LTQTAPQVESAGEVRKRVRRLKKEIDSSYIQLGKDFYLIYHRRLYQKWGFDSFTDYVEEEVGMAKQRAERCRRIWTKFVKECGVKPKELDGIGYTNALLLLSVVKSDNVKKWIDTAKGIKRDEFDKVVSREPLSYRDLETAIAAAKSPSASAVADLPVAGVVPEPDPVPAQTDDTPGSSLPPVPAGRRRLAVNCHPSQYKVIDAAISEAKRTKPEEMAENEALAHVATEFLAARMSKEEKPLVRVQFLLANLETSYGGKFVWVNDPAAATFLGDCMKQRPDLFSEPVENEE
jgi:hypothetical protein